MPLPPSPGFLVNDLAHAPFGAAWLRGVTLGRVAILVGVCFVVAFHGVRVAWLMGDWGETLWRFWDRFGRTFACAVPMFLLIIGTEAGTARWRPGKRVAALAIAVLVGAALYTLARGGLRAFHGTIVDPATFHEALIAYFSRALLVGGLLTAIMYFAAREREATRSLYRTRVARVEIERQLVESKLKLLQAQIEPHFLFNSLASVKRLYESDSGKASALLLNLAAYLREATLRVRQREIPLKDEVALARSFLAIFQVRMGRRLQVRIDVPADLDAAMVPPLTVGTLIENAVKHGIGPRAAGGCVAVTARREGDVLVVQVGDDGVGFRSKSGSGVGLSNVRARLETLFGAAGRLDLDGNSVGGVTATLRLPCRIGEYSPQAS